MTSTINLIANNMSRLSAPVQLLSLDQFSTISESIDLEPSDQSVGVEPSDQSIDSEEDHRDDHPDGGTTAYLVALGGFTGIIVCLGLINSIGAIQAYVSNHQLKGTNPIVVSWIFAIYLSLAYSMGIIAGPIFDIWGARGLLIATNLLVFGGIMGSASSNKLWQFVLSFVCLGVGNGIGLTPLVNAPNHWFMRKRGLITGVVTAGGSFGGLVFPLLLNNFFGSLGYVTALRILAAICFGCLTISIIFVKTRVTRKRELTLELSDLTWNRIWIMSREFVARHNDKTFLFVIGGSFCTELAFIELTTYFVSFFMAHGIPESTSFILLAVWNGLSIAGRVIPGYFSDHFGKFNVNILMIVGLDLCFFTMWLPFGDNLKVMYTFAVLGGFFLGLILSMLPTCLAQITVVSKLGERYGLLNFILSIGNLIGVPIGAAIIGHGSVERYRTFAGFVGALTTAGVLFYIGARMVIVGTKMRVKV